MNEVSFPFCNDILESLTIELGSDEIFPSRETDMLTLFSIASLPDEHRLLFPIDEWWDFLLRDSFGLESGSDWDLLKLPMQPLYCIN